MSHSLYFLTASWLAAQTPAPMPSQVSPAPIVIEAAPGSYDNGWQPQTQNNRRGVFSWLHDRINSLFGRRSPNDQQPVMQGTRQVVPQQPINFNEPPLFKPPTAQIPPGPQSQNASPSPIAQASHESGRSQLNLPVNEKYREQIGHETDYRWITGQLYRLEADGRPLWVIRYATEDIQDAHGGSVVLVSSGEMRNYRNGDLVSVQGQLLNSGARSEQAGAPLYRASDINLIERGE